MCIPFTRRPNIVQQQENNIAALGPNEQPAPGAPAPAPTPVPVAPAPAPAPTPVTPPAATPPSPVVQTEQRRLRGRGRESTIRTSSRGILDALGDNGRRKTLLGA